MAALAFSSPPAEAADRGRTLFPACLPAAGRSPQAGSGGGGGERGGGEGRPGALEGGAAAAGGRGGALAALRPAPLGLPAAGRGSPAARSARSGRAWGSCCRCSSAHVPQLRRRRRLLLLLSRPEARSHSWIPAGKGPWAASPRRGGCEAAGARSESREAAGRLGCAGGAAAGAGDLRVPRSSPAPPSAAAAVDGWMRHGHAGVPGAAAG